MAFSDVCPSLHKYGVTADHLLSITDDSDGDTLGTVRIPCVTNEIVIELYHFMDRNARCTFYTLWRWISIVLGDRWPTEGFPTVKSVRQSVVRIVSRTTKLKKQPAGDQKSAALSSFLSELYHIPSIFVSRGRIITSTDSSSSCSSCAENDILKEENTKLSQKLSEARQKMYSLHRYVFAGILCLLCVY